MYLELNGLGWSQCSGKVVVEEMKFRKFLIKEVTWFLEIHPDSCTDNRF